MPAEILGRLEAGEQSANHMEQIAMDMGNLLTSQIPAAEHRAGELRTGGLVAKMRTGGRVLVEELGLNAATDSSDWSSDTVRGWAAMAVGAAPGLDLRERLDRIRPYAADPHFAVREWAWLSVRPHVAVRVGDAIDLLLPWTAEESPLLRRFACEATRPRGVWSSHLPELKTWPYLGLPILEPLRGDPERYVQDSVANWLNDASKTQPEWVAELCAEWLVGPDAAATQRICKRAQRSLATAD